MTQDAGAAATGEDLARDVVRKRMTSLRLSGRRLAALAQVDKNTVGNYLSGRTERPQAETLGAIETVLGWPLGTVEDIARGRQLPEVVLSMTFGSGKSAAALGHVLTRTDESPGVSGRPPAGVVDLPPEVEAGLTEAQAAEVRAHAYAEAMRRRREIMNGA